MLERLGPIMTKKRTWQSTRRQAKKLEIAHKPQTSMLSAEKMTNSFRSNGSTRRCPMEDTDHEDD